MSAAGLRWAAALAIPANHAEVIAICGRIIYRPADWFGRAFTGRDDRDRSLQPDMAALQRNVDLTREISFIKAIFDISKYGDLGMVEEEAAGRLK